MNETLREKVFELETEIKTLQLKIMAKYAAQACLREVYACDRQSDFPGQCEGRRRLHRRSVQHPRQNGLFNGLIWPKDGFASSA